MKAKHSRLHCIFEKGNKARVIALGDYFSQSVLYPIHNVLLGILKRIPMDSTFDQDGGADRVKALTKGSEPCYSLDLSAATDRLPVKFLEHVISGIFQDPYLARL